MLSLAWPLRSLTLSCDLCRHLIQVIIACAAGFAYMNSDSSLMIGCHLQIAECRVLEQLPALQELPAG